MISRQNVRRRAALTVETALVMFPFVLLAFSIFEYGRFVMIRHLLNHAAREGCRYAVVNNTSATVTTDTDTRVRQQIVGSDVTDLQNFTVSVTAVDAAGTNTATLLADIKPGESIAVRVAGDFRTMFPTLFYLPLTIPMSSKVIMTCEGD